MHVRNFVFPIQPELFGPTNHIVTYVLLQYIVESYEYTMLGAARKLIPNFVRTRNLRSFPTPLNMAVRHSSNQYLEHMMNSRYRINLFIS
jgi:hypothetical protein